MLPSTSTSAALNRPAFISGTALETSYRPRCEWVAGLSCSIHVYVSLLCIPDSNSKQSLCIMRIHNVDTRAVGLAETLAQEEELVSGRAARI